MCNEYFYNASKTDRSVTPVMRMKYRRVAYEIHFFPEGTWVRSILSEIPLLISHQTDFVKMTDELDDHIKESVIKQVLES